MNTKKQKQHMDQNASFSVKHGQVHHGYKSHIKVDMDYYLIREYHVTTASVHDSDIDLSEQDEVVYRDKGYTGKEVKSKGNGSMKRGNLSIKDKLW